MAEKITIEMELDEYHRFTLRSYGHSTPEVCSAVSNFEAAFCNSIYYALKVRPVTLQGNPAKGSLKVSYKIPYKDRDKNPETVKKLIQFDAILAMFLEGLRGIMKEEPEKLEVRFHDVQKKSFFRKESKQIPIDKMIPQPIL